MKIFKTIVTLSGTGKGIIYKADTIEYEGKMWLVPTWLETPSVGWKTPERIVCLDELPYQKASFGDADFILTNPIPKDVLFGQITDQSIFKSVVIIRPDIRIAIPKGVH